MFSKYLTRKCLIRIRLSKYVYQQQRQCSSGVLPNHNLGLDPGVGKDLEEGNYKHRRHPGIVSVPPAKLPSNLEKAVRNVLELYHVSNLDEKAKDFTNWLWSRKLPAEDEQISNFAKRVERQVLEQDQIAADSLSYEEKEQLLPKVKKKVLMKTKKYIYHWKPVDYTAVQSLVYLVARLQSDYSSVFRVLNEVKSRDPTFKPETLFDFGSGPGSALWATNEIWPNNLTEQYCVDSSADMNTLARLLLQDGEQEAEMCFPGVYFRQFTPTSFHETYDLATCTHTLLELPTQAERLKVLFTLWRKTHNYLVLIENGTNAGFGALAEARDFLLQVSREYSCKPPKSAHANQSLQGHVFAPCPHDLPCPRYTTGTTPCNFPVSYHKTAFSQGKNNHESVRFCYLVMKKGERSSQASWPRLVRESSKSRQFIHCRTCSTNGELQFNIIMKRKHGKDLYKCAKASDWGDLLPGVHADVSTEKDQAAQDHLETDDNIETLVKQGSS